MKAPAFWQKGRGGLTALALSPLGCLYGTITQRRAHRTPDYKAQMPVICIGNLTMGGAGKTPTALAIAEMLRSMGLKPCFLSRGYGGTTEGPVWVTDQSANEVGDEPLLLVQKAPVCVAKDRIKGAKLCDQSDADVIILDDGFQNPSLYKDLSLIVIDGGYGHGNNRLFPAGPLRETLKSGLSRADGIILISEDHTDVLGDIKTHAPDMPIVRTDIIVKEMPADQQKPVFAFAGIARPEKFYASLQQNGFNIAETLSFADHHPFKTEEINKIRERAAQLNAEIITTEKDLVRLTPDQRHGISALKIALAWRRPDMLKAVLHDKLKLTDPL